jgi:hypothetical protein
MRGGLKLPNAGITAQPQCTVAEMTEEAIAFLQQHEPEEGYFLGFSGGKDSRAF